MRQRHQVHGNASRDRWAFILDRANSRSRGVFRGKASRNSRIMEPSCETVSAVVGFKARLILALLCGLVPLATRAAALTSMPPSSGWVEWFGPDGYGDGEGCFVPAGNQFTSLGLVQTAASQSVDCGGATLQYTTAMMSLQSYSFTYGVIEYRAKFAGGRGTWPSVWLLGTECQPYGGHCDWPYSGSNEIDITEVKLGLPSQNVFNQITGEVFSWQPQGITDVTGNYHDYRLVWSPTEITWFVDGVQTLVISDPSYVPTTPMFVLIDIFLGKAGGGGPIDPSTFPQSTDIQYLRVCPLGTSTCDSAHATILDDEFRPGTEAFYPRHPSDLVWYRSADGALSVWPAGNSAQGRYLTSIPGSSGWQLAGLGDFNGDGQTDLLWYRGSDGSLCIWPSGDSSRGYYLTSEPADTGWKLAGIGDFTGDGRDDLLWYRSSDGSLEVWPSGDSTNGYPLTSEPASSGWQIGSCPQAWCTSRDSGSGWTRAQLTTAGSRAD
jgi:hypothetical protein